MLRRYRSSSKFGERKLATCPGVCKGIHCFLDAPVFAAGVTTQEAARASPFMTDHPLLPGNFRIIFHDNDVCDFSLNECTKGLAACKMQQLKRLMARWLAEDTVDLGAEVGEGWMLHRHLLSLPRLQR